MGAQKQYCHFLGTAEGVCRHAARIRFCLFGVAYVVCQKLTDKAGL